MFGIYYHPATRFVCRHCKKDAGYDPEMCVYCGPICADCFLEQDTKDCEGEKRFLSEIAKAKEKKL